MAPPTSTRQEVGQKGHQRPPARRAYGLQPCDSRRRPRPSMTTSWTTSCEITKPTFVHIGYPKCASTSLQIDLFRKHPEVYFLGIGYPPYTFIDRNVGRCID